MREPAGFMLAAELTHHARRPIFRESQFLAGQKVSIRIPDWMSPTPGFIMDATSAGAESVGCYATDTDVADKLPALLMSTALVAIKGTTSLRNIDEAFDASLGKQSYTSSRIQWLVAPKPAAPVAAAPPPAGAPK